MQCLSIIGLAMASTCLASPLTPAMAQVAEDQAASTGGDIIVTAQKRSENVQKIPIAVTVVGEAQLARQNIISVTDLKASSPALEFAPPGQTPGSGGFIRGIGTVITSSTAEPSVGLVVDGVPQGNVPQSSVFDVARVEVLRGPQGTLFGSAASAGLVNITTNAPRLGEFSGKAEFELAEDGFAGSEYSRRIGRLVVNAPLGQNAALRVSGHFDSIDDVTHNNALGKGSDRNDRGVRARLLWEPSSDVTFNIIADYNKVNTRNAPYFTFYNTRSQPLIDVLAGCGITIGEGNGETCNAMEVTNQVEQFGISGSMDVTLGRHTLTWTTGYRWQNQKETASIDGLPTSSRTSPFPNIFYGPGYDKKSLLTQEVRLTSPSTGTIEYVVGGYYSRYEGERDYLSRVTLGFTPAPVPIVISTAYHQSPLVETFAGFGQATVHVNDTIRLLGGARYTSNEVTARVTVTQGGAPGFYRASSTVNNFSWKVGAQADLTNDVMVYATASRGFKGQTYNDDSTLGTTPTYVRPEVPTALELGVKGKILGRIGFDLNVFHTKVKNYQAQVCAPDAQRGVVCAPQNIDSLTTKGIEAGLFGELLPGLNVNAGMIYVDAKFPKGFIGTDGTDLGGYQVTYSARWKGVLSGEYEANLSDTMTAYFGADTVYRSRIRYVTAGGNDVTFKPHFITGARAGVRLADGKYELGVFARNMFGIREPVLRYNSPIGVGTTTQILADSSFRVVGLQGKVNF
ncbi:TonB-dependent receptor (plasmid) [Novosphingobium resinovorum]|uniref:TonB-dependent receptor n=1 Tax=Novosphingobium TaxID=165696 RepID=UPI001B3CA3EA|nr:MULTISPECIES: TonB-dependent receptor [Novosphingobium]MBF7015688.1 TonB-dependent receptor [Novosphingobium sp. HR1a]WJM29680.1 TonB-dependent receptor [Novosphingobium resinovorum]